MMRRSPMKPGKGFKRGPTPPRKKEPSGFQCPEISPDAPMLVASGASMDLREARRAALMASPGRAAVMGGSTAGPIEKPREHRCPALLEMARGESCLLRVPGVCNRDPATTVACHSNLGEHGKAGARKADDFWSVHGCSACHAWLDQDNTATYEEKRAIFMLAHEWMVLIWSDVAYGPRWGGGSTPRERKAAAWALDHLAGRCTCAQ